MAKVAQNAADATVTEDIVYLYTEAGKLSTRTTLSKRQNEKLSVMTRTLVGSSVWGKISVKDASGVPAYYWINLASTSLGTYSVTPGTGTTTPTTPTTPGNTGNTGNTGTATTTASGTVVNADEVNVRSGAGVANAKVTSLKRGAAVTVHEQKTVDNALWGRIDQGWIAMQYVDLSSKANNGTTTTVPSGTISGNTILTTVPSGRFSFIQRSTFFVFETAPGSTRWRMIRPRSAMPSESSLSTPTCLFISLIASDARLK